MAELQVRAVSVQFGGVRALSRVDLQVAAGRVHGLIGPNGAGKTTLFNVATGLVAPSTGQVLIDGTDVTGARPHVRARRGLARTFQRLEVCGTLTVRENVQLAAEARRGAAADRSAATADRLLGELGIGHIADEPADAIPVGYARLVEIARALATDPSILLLDEPSSGLDGRETDALGRVLRRLAGQGMAVLLVEHDMGLVMEVCDELTVLDAGQVIAAGDPATVRADPAVQQAYLGTPAAPASADGVAGTPIASAGANGVAATPAAPVGSTVPLVAGTDTRVPAGPGPAAVAVPAVPAAPPSAAGPLVAAALAATFAGGAGADGAVALSLEGVHAAYGRIEVLHGVSLRLRPGAVFALLGPNGAGKSTLLKLCSGRMAPSAGRVWVGGRPVGRRGPSDLARAGICAIPEGRAVFPNLTVADNLLMATYRSPSVRQRDVEAKAFSTFPRLAQRRHQLAGSLSGGEQQMLALARALTTGPRVLLLDELSMGLAPLVVDELYRTVAGLAADEGLTVLLVEQFAEAALSLATEAAVLVGGRIVRHGSPAEVAEVVTGAYLGG